MVAQFCEYTQNQWMGWIKWVYWVVQELYLHKAVKKKKKKKKKASKEKMYYISQFLQLKIVALLFGRSVASNSFCDPMDRKPTRLLCPWDFPGKNTGVGCHFLLQGIFLT